jgi:hypothetical protein
MRALKLGIHGNRQKNRCSHVGRVVRTAIEKALSRERKIIFVLKTLIIVAELH